MNHEIYVWGRQLTNDEVMDETIHKLTSQISGRSCAIQTRQGVPFFISFPGPKPKIEPKPGIHTIAFPGPKPKKTATGAALGEYLGEGDLEEFLRIPTKGAPWHVETAPDSNTAFISFGGEKPRLLHLDMGDMAWRVHTDATGENLKVSLKP